MGPGGIPFSAEVPVSRKLPPEAKRTLTISFRVRPDEGQEIAHRAATAGRSRGDYLREQALGLPDVALNGTPPPPPPIPPEILHIAHRLLEEYVELTHCFDQNFEGILHRHRRRVSFDRDDVTSFIASTQDRLERVRTQLLHLYNRLSTIQQKGFIPPPPLPRPNPPA